ncbi:LamG domain-containing protein, partial [Oleiphilus sp. HI0132]|uniref:LamG domain-containing protein n=1 Tax=Oleiphilus sp. HI0132 TaxID=1822270 RepID=UPI001E3C44A0
MLWYRAEENWVGSGDKTLIDATTDVIGNSNDKYFFLAKLNDGRLRFALEDSADLDFNLYTSANSVVAGTWVHLGVTWDLSAD